MHHKNLINSLPALLIPSLMQPWQVAQGLEISLPDQTPCQYAYVFKVGGQDLKPSDAVKKAARPVAEGR